MPFKEPTITDQTFTYVINSNDTALEDRLTLIDNETDYYRWKLHTEWRQSMGAYLPSHTKKFECHTIRYEWGNVGVNNLDVATMIYSDLNEKGTNSLAIDTANKHKLLPISNYSNMCRRLNGTSKGSTRMNSNILHDCKFICKNFNGQKKHFRINPILNNNVVNSFDGDDYTITNVYGGGHHVYPDFFSALAAGKKIGNAIIDGDAGGINADTAISQQNAPITTIYMTPIPEQNEPIPRLLLKEDSIIYTISSTERTKNLFRGGATDSGFHCIVPFKRVMSEVRRYKAVVIGFNYTLDLLSSFTTPTKSNNMLVMFGCKNWNKSNYGYLGNNQIWGKEDANGFDNLTQFRPAINNELGRQYACSFGSIMDIDNVNTDVEFAMYNPMGYLFGTYNAPFDFFPLNNANPKAEWLLTLRLFPLN